VSAAIERAPVSPARHLRAIALLPFTNTVVIPGVLLALLPPAQPSWDLAASAATTVGIALMAAGAALVAHCVRLFVRFGAGTLAPWDPAHKLVSAGAYAHSRNPMKAGLFIALAGEALATRSLALAAWLGCFALANVLYIRMHEEPGLTKRFGAPYREYCARVPRWWPALHRSPKTEVQ
jgi:protein-S-isoprenylcysteine O-methyltransferase Ste14